MQTEQHYHRLPKQIERTPITRIITHKNCPDGMASAMLLNRAFPGVEIEFKAYGDPIEVTEGMLFCDFSPPESTIEEHQKVKTIILDHHPTAKPIVDAMGERGYWGRNSHGESGAWLAYNVLRTLKPINSVHKRFASLAGIRDTWQKDNLLWRKSCEQATVLMFYPPEYWLNPWRSYGPSLSPEEEELGLHLLEHRLQKARELGDTCHLVTARKTHMLIAFVNQTGELVSDCAEYVRNEYDAALCVFYQEEDGDRGLGINVSLRGDGSFDCGKMAKEYGGGGHHDAAGFYVPVSNVNDRANNRAKLMSFVLNELE